MPCVGSAENPFSLAIAKSSQRERERERERELPGASPQLQFLHPSRFQLHSFLHPALTQFPSTLIFPYPPLLLPHFCFPLLPFTSLAILSQPITTAPPRSSKGGMHPRPFLRTSSKCQLIPSCGYDNPPPPAAAEVIKAPHHVVIGFHLVSEDTKPQRDACNSPRSVLESCPASNPEHLRSPRSPRSVLGCLFSGQESHRPFREGVGLGVVAAIKAEEVRAPRSSHSQSKSVAISVQNEVVGVRNRNVCEGGFVADPQEFHCSVIRDEDFIDFEVDEDPVTGMHESIFCAASPFSTCCSLDYPTRDFLSVCFYCKCHLSHGKDVYMYKGDKAFCSSECRYQQIVVDEFKERQSTAANCYVGASTENAKMFAGASAAVA